MNNLNLAQRVKELRNSKGISQEILAEKSGLCLRTIQRIENNETVPRGDTLKRLADALDTSPDKIIGWKIKEDKNYLALMSLYSLSFLLFPLLGVIIPLTMWIVKKDKLKNVNELGKSILNFQITWALLLFLYLIFATMLNIEMLGLLFISIPVIILYVYNIIVSIINTIRIGNNKSLTYKPAIQFL